MDRVGHACELVSDSGEICGIDDVLLHLFIKKSSGEANLNGSLDFIAGQHPDFDAILLE